MASITLSWPANPATDNVIAYDVYGANGTSVVFGSTALLASVNALTWTDTGLPNSQARTYYLKARNAIGSSAADGPFNISTGAPSSTYVQNAGGAPSVQEGLHSARPAAGNAGAVYIETDTKTIWRDNGASWDQIGSAGLPGGSSGQIQYNNASSFGGFTASGDATINTTTGAVSVTKTGGVAFAPSATTDTTNASNISSGVLGSSRGGAGAITGVMYANGSGAVSALSIGSGLSLVGSTLTATGLGGTVTSVGLSLPGIFSVTGSPITGAGTLTGALANQNANLVWAGPSSGGAAAPTFRALVAADLPAGTSAIYMPLVSGDSTTGLQIVGNPDNEIIYVQVA